MYTKKKIYNHFKCTTQPAYVTGKIEKYIIKTVNLTSNSLTRSRRRLPPE